MRLLHAVVCVCLAALMAAPVCASDFSFGSSARSVAMGGAGLALADNGATGVVLNPAAPAASGARPSFIFPGLEFHTQGASFGDLLSSVGKLGSDNTADTLSLVNEFGSHPTSLSMGMVTGIAGPLGVTGTADAEALINPGPEAAKWAGAAMQFDGGVVDLLDVQSQLDNSNLDMAISQAQAGDIDGANQAFDAYLEQLSDNFVSGGYVYGPGISFSHGFSTAGGGKLWLGTNLSFLKSEAHIWQVQATREGSVSGASTDVSADVSFDAVETEVLKHNTTKMDLGFIYRPGSSKLQYGMAIENFLEPDLPGIPNRRDGRSISLGVAFLPARNITCAADLVNLNSANGEEAQIRMGAEIKLGKWAAFRAGYAGSNWTCGIGVRGLNLAWAGDSARLITNVLKF